MIMPIEFSFILLAAIVVLVVIFFYFVPFLRCGISARVSGVSISLLQLFLMAYPESPATSYCTSHDRSP